MAFSIYTFANGVRSLVHENNTTTSGYDISNGLASRVKLVTLGYYTNKPLINISYPVVYVSSKSKVDNFSQLGSTAKRRMTIQMEITGIVQYGQGQLNGREASDEQMLKLSANLETLFRNYITLSNTAQVTKSLITGIEYDAVDYTDTYNSITKIALECEVLST